jgi:hypothetical protein
MKLTPLILWVVILASCSPVGAPPSAGTETVAPLAQASVLRAADKWTVDFRFAKASPAWVFVHSAVTQDGAPWRAQRWQVETAGVRLERHGYYDALVADRGLTVPTHVRIRFTPFAGKLLADYEPALAFTDGSIALFSDQFDVFPVGAVAQVAKLPLDLGTTEIVGGDTRVTFRDQGALVMARGERHRSLMLQHGRTFVLFGKASTVEGPDIATVVDPQLPKWLQAEITASAPRILSLYAEKLGARSGPKPTLMVSWKGPTPKRRSMGGSVLPGLIVMAFEGDSVVNENPATIQTARWFIGHESAHFWLGETIRQEFARDAWISEGGADLLAIRALSMLDPRPQLHDRLQSEIDDCVKLSTGRALATAGERNENRAYYACGAVFGLVAEAAEQRAGGGDFFSFWRSLIETNRSDGIVTKDEWLEELTRISGDPTLARDIATLVDTGTDRPADLLASLFDRARIGYTRAPDGRLLIRENAGAEDKSVT